MRLKVRAGQANEIGQFAQCHVDAQRARSRAVMRDIALERRGQHATLDQPFEQDLGMRVGNHDRRVELATIVQAHAARAPTLKQHAVDPRVDLDLGPVLGRVGAQRVRDRAHAAQHMALLALDAGRFAEDMVKENISCARRIGRLIIADAAEEGERALDQRSIEPFVEQVADAHCYQLRKELACLWAELACGRALADRGEEIAPAPP